LNELLSLGGSYVRWDATKEISYHLTERLEPMEDGNSIDEIERRTDLIEAQVLCVMCV